MQVLENMINKNILCNNAKTKKIGIITYNCKHLKTEQILNALCNKGYDVTVFALPFVERPMRDTLFSHRPNQLKASHTREVSQKLGFRYILCNDDSEIINGCDYYLICGAGILSEKCVQNKRIINCHPGLIPASRGLDSFKWAIYDFIPVGNTLHFIDYRVDAGEIIYQEATPLFISDTIENFALRHYEYEIKILLDFEKHLEVRSTRAFELSEGIAHKRMPQDIEKQMLVRFEEYKARFAVR